MYDLVWYTFERSDDILLCKFRWHIIFRYTSIYIGLRIWPNLAHFCSEMFISKVCYRTSHTSTSFYVSRLTLKFFKMKISGWPARLYVCVTGCGPPASARVLRDSGGLHSSTERDSSFPHSTPGVVPSVPTCIHKLISLSQPVYG